MTFATVVLVLAIWGILGLAGYALTSVLKLPIRIVVIRVWGVVEDNERRMPRDGSTVRDLYRGAVRTIPVTLCALFGSADLLAALLEADLSVWGVWPDGVSPFLGALIGAGAGGLAIRTHTAIGDSLAGGIRGLWSALAARLGGTAAPPIADYDAMVRPEAQYPDTLDSGVGTDTLSDAGAGPVEGGDER